MAIGLVFHGQYIIICIKIKFFVAYHVDGTRGEVVS